VAGARLEPLVLSDDERHVLEGWARRRKTAQALAGRSRIVLACAGGAPVSAVASELGISRATAAKWRSRFLHERLEGLADEPRPGRPRTITDDHVEKVITATLQQEPGGGARWSTRSMASQVGMSQTAISRIWRAFGLKPHLAPTRTPGTDPRFADKVRDVVGLYLDPSGNALVLCVDETSQIQPIERTNSRTAALPAIAAWVTRDGTVSLSAAGDLADGLGSAQHDRRRHPRLLRFLKQTDQAVPDELDLYLICDNRADLQAPEISRWLLRHPRFHPHITQVNSSWPKVMEGWFAEFTSRKLSPSAHRGMNELEADICAWTGRRDENPGPFVWTKTADQVRETLVVYGQLINNSEHSAGAAYPAQAGPLYDRPIPRGTTMLAAERRDLLLARLRRDGKLVARDLAAELGLSDDSVRRDLRELAAAGLCQRVYGGALPASPAVGTTHARRSEIAPESKRRVGAAAARLITPGITAILGAGTTALEVVAALPPDLDATIITHSATTAAALATHPAVKVLTLGGLLHKQSVSALGAMTAEAASGITADLALLIMPGIHPTEGFTTSDPEDAALKRILISRTADTYIMASIEKLGTVCSYKISGLADVAGIITDAPADHPTVQQLRDQGATIIQAA
jgi:DeoR/GlpR family transcriptional regulator of sugar metabolism/transposase